MKNLKIHLTAFCILFSFQIMAQNIDWNSTEAKAIVIKDSLQKIEVQSVNNGDIFTFNGIELNTSCVNSSFFIVIFTLKAGKWKITSCQETIPKEIADGKYFLIKTSLLNEIDTLIIDLKLPIVSSELSIPISSSLETTVFDDANILAFGNNDAKDIIFRKYKWADDNLFLKEINIGEVQSNALTISASSSLLKKVAGLDVTNYAQGLANFIVARVKAELSIAYFNEFKKTINKDKYKDLATLFPKTKAQFDLIGDEIYNFKFYLNSLRLGMEGDFVELPEHFKALTIEPDSKIYKKLEEKRLRFLVNAGLNTALAIKSKVHPGTALAQLQTTGFENTDKNILALIQSLQLFSNALQSGNKEDFWINQAQFAAFKNEDKKLLKYFLGLVAEKAKSNSIIFENNSMYELLNAEVANFEKFLAIIESIEKVANSVREINSAKINLTTDFDKKLNSLNYFEASAGLLKVVEPLSSILQIDLTKTKLVSIINNTSQLVANTTTKNYSTALLYLTKIMNDFELDDNLISQITRKGLFVAQMAEAKTSDDVTIVLETFAAPIGSWRDKHLSKINMAVDSYLGPSFYYIKDDRRIALSTPVGLSISTLIGNTKTGWPITIFSSLVDLGPLASVNLNGTKTGSSKVYLKEIFAPGIFGSFSLGKNSPVAINIGYQQLSILQNNANNTSQEIKKEGAFMAGLNVNVPVFTLINR